MAGAGGVSGMVKSERDPAQRLRTRHVFADKPSCQGFAVRHASLPRPLVLDRRLVLRPRPPLPSDASCAGTATSAACGSRGRATIPAMACSSSHSSLRVVFPSISVPISLFSTARRSIQFSRAQDQACAGKKYIRCSTHLRKFSLAPSMSFSANGSRQVALAGDAPQPRRLCARQDQPSRSCHHLLGPVAMNTESQSSSVAFLD